MTGRMSLALLLAAVNLVMAGGAAASKRPNVVVIMTDNHGAWTLGCYGNQDIRTPHIDRLARQGTLFTHAFASNPVCSPTRATFLTGLVPSQHGVHCFLFGGRLQIGPQARCTLDQLRSLPEVLRDEGYSCGLVGKWHLGDNLHPQEGFDDYWVTMPHGGTSTFYNAQIIENGKLRKEPQYLTDFWTGHAVKFIEQSARRDKPFFLFLSYNGPYALGRLLLRQGRNRHAEHYADKRLLSFPREATHPWQFSNRDYHNNPISNRRVATEVSGVDDGVGTVMAALDRNGLDENTIVIFLADQGWVGGQGGFFGMGDHTRPLTARDGMMRIPMIWRQPGKIAAKVKSDRLVANYDVMPTILSRLGLSQKMPTTPPSPGRDFSDELNVQRPSKPKRASSDDAIYYEFENLRCIRTRNWKYVHRHPNGPHELYDLKKDPREFNNLTTTAALAKTRDGLKRRLDEFYGRYAVSKYDMWRKGGSQTRTFVGIDEELAQRKVAPPPPLPAGFVPQKINVPEGFSVELAAGPPLVQHPTFATFDDRGRLFVSENAGVNMTAKQLEEARPNSVRMLEDTDNDGRFDKSTVFADKMTFPMGGAWHDGALYVASPPSIWRLQDTTGDGKADKRDVIVNKFGFNGNAASIHGCFLGPDGRLYWCDGFHGHEFKDASGRVTSKRKGSYIFSSNTDGTDVRLHCGGGMDNPVEVDFTDEGELLGTVNILYTRPRVDCLVHWLHGGTYPHREQILSEAKVTGDFLGPVHRFGHVAISGTMRYRSGVMDHRWRNNMFATFFNSGKVVRLEMERQGATFAVTQREFLSSANREFHPTDVTEDADGSLLVVDTGGWFYRGCPTSQHAKPDIKGAIYRVRRTTMTTLPDPWGLRIDWPKVSAGQLMNLLNDTRFQVRERAIAECAARGSAIVPTLRKTIQRRDIRARQNAVWALTRIIGGLMDQARRHPELAAKHRAAAGKAHAAVRLALGDLHPAVRLTAARSVTIHPQQAAMGALTMMLRIDQGPQRREAATALGRIGDPSVVPALLSALQGHGVDRSEEHAIIYALIEINRAIETRRGLASTNAFVQRGALIALDQMDAGELTADDVIKLAGSNDALLQQAAGDVLSRHTDWSTRAAEVLTRLLARPAAAGRNSAVVGRLIGKFLADPAVGKLLGHLLSAGNTSATIREVIWDSMAGARDVPLHSSWVAPIEQLLASNEASKLSRVLAVLTAIKTDRFKKQLQRIGADEKQPATLRVSALQLAAGKRSALADSAFQLLVAELAAGNSSHSLSAAQKLAVSSLSKSQALRLAPFLTAAGPSELRELLRPFQRSGDMEIAKAFLDAMKKARGLTSLAPHEFSNVIKRYPRPTLPLANQLLQRIRDAEQKKLSRLDALLPLLKQGDVVRGRNLFFAEKSKCATCHTVAGKGGKIGPDLSTIGSNRAAGDLLESIVFPSATLVRDYEPHNIRTADGRVFSGLIVRQTADTIYLQQQTGEPLAIARSDIDERMPGNVSIMPNGLEKALSESELADVIAYLMSLKRNTVTLKPKQ